MYVCSTYLQAPSDAAAASDIEAGDLLAGFRDYNNRGRLRTERSRSRSPLRRSQSQWQSLSSPTPTATARVSRRGLRSASESPRDRYEGGAAANDVAGATDEEIRLANDNAETASMVKDLLRLAKNLRHSDPVKADGLTVTAIFLAEHAQAQRRLRDRQAQQHAAAAEHLEHRRRNDRYAAVADPADAAAATRGVVEIGADARQPPAQCTRCECAYCRK